ncbi:MAG: hypothetical protein K1X29_07255 [Bdellovibrionales bacterium]|nr:hypothetical protein [Bdellovibrionales bacterium]
MAKNLFALFIGVALFLGCKSNLIKSDKNKEDADAKSWAGEMQGMAKEVHELIPYIYSRQAFNDPKNFNKISHGLKKLSSQVHQISPEMGKTFFGEDPLVSYSLINLQSDLTRAAESFQMGQVEYARGVALAATNHCFRCHSLTKVGAQAQWDVNKMTSVNMRPMEKADLIVASRHYEQAIQFLEGLMMDKEYMQNFPFEYETGLRKYLTLMIRVEKNPNRAATQIKRVLGFKELPYSVMEKAKVWQSSLLEWKNSLGKKNKKSLVDQAKRRIARGMELQQFAKDHVGDIEFLRATELVHEFLRQEKNPEKNSLVIAEAYFLLGQAYEVLDDLGDWNLHEAYFESCIKNAPRTVLAQKCYGRLESSVYLGFSGSSGVHIPANEKERLKKYKEMTM